MGKLEQYYWDKDRIIEEVIDSFVIYISDDSISSEPSGNVSMMSFSSALTPL